jgi:hypothetical protein
MHTQSTHMAVFSDLPDENVYAIFCLVFIEPFEALAFASSYRIGPDLDTSW